MSTTWKAAFISAPKVDRPDPEEAKQPLPADLSRRGHTVATARRRTTASAQGRRSANSRSMQLRSPWRR